MIDINPDVMESNANDIPNSGEWTTFENSVPWPLSLTANNAT